MRRSLSTALLMVPSMLLTAVVAAPPAAAATGRVFVFSVEVQEVREYKNPDGCVKLPIAAHVLINDTDETVRIYADPFCMTPSLTVRPGYGSHVAPGTGSFSA
ncbi:hypothetical protein N8J89_18505 [Crossiella sp. CA-258035]|uniref:hypothetical protein n=1 Tax=Crossiella sp. CA-258035 TaxID=2981138 RepID=UPI0024BBFAF4|nr:hypothetical protein [Crossiella sp. CA-258035]WHT22984.1 hypothetical protein N8J89_18505 [Crossiella sp. CA-258035]